MTQIKFDNTFYDLERDIDSYMKAMHGTLRGQMSLTHSPPPFRSTRELELWRWAMNVPLLEPRFHDLITASDEMIDYVNKCKFDKRSVLDLGCGFCQYWPFLQKYGFNEFVGCDLFSLRGQGDQGHMKAAEDLSAKFCQKSITKI